MQTYEQYEAEQERLRRVEARRIWEEEHADDEENDEEED